LLFLNISRTCLSLDNIVPWISQLKAKPSSVTTHLKNSKFPIRKRRSEAQLKAQTELASSQLPHMRLLNTRTIQLHEFFDDHIPLYVILSHRWEGAEVTFQDLNGGRTNKKGYEKILGCCAQAREHGYEFAVRAIPSRSAFSVSNLGC